jgi:hypothetical protein
MDSWSELEGVTAWEVPETLSLTAQNPELPTGE